MTVGKFGWCDWPLNNKTDKDCSVLLSMNSFNISCSKFDNSNLELRERDIITIAFDPIPFISSLDFP